MRIYIYIPFLYRVPCLYNLSINCAFSSPEMVRWTLWLVVLVAFHSALQWGLSNHSYRKTYVLDGLWHAFAAHTMEVLLGSVVAILSCTSFEFVRGGEALAIATVTHILVTLCAHLFSGAPLVPPEPLLSFLATIHMLCIVGRDRPAAVDASMPALGIVFTRRFYIFILLVVLIMRHCIHWPLWAASMSTTYILSYGISERLCNYYSASFVTKQAKLEDSSDRLMQDVGYSVVHGPEFASTSSSFVPSDEALAQLIALGFEREQCSEALKRSRGNIQEACNALLDL